MLVIYPAKKSEEAVDEKKSLPPVKPEDWPYMAQSGEILRYPPQTWKVYPDDKDGGWAIIEMEFHELMNSKNMTKPDIMRELVHLGTATLALWRKYAAE